MARRREEEEVEELKRVLCEAAGMELSGHAKRLSRIANVIDPFYVAEILRSMYSWADQAEDVCGCMGVKELVREFDEAIEDWIIEKEEDAQRKVEELAKEITEKLKECKLI